MDRYVKEINYKDMPAYEIVFGNYKALFAPELIVLG